LNQYISSYALINNDFSARKNKQIYTILDATYTKHALNCIIFDHESGNKHYRETSLYLLSQMQYQENNNCKFNHTIILVFNSNFKISNIENCDNSYFLANFFYFYDQHFTFH